MNFRRSIISTLALLVLTGAAHAQANYPNQPIRMIVPLAAASAVDVAARIVTQKMSENMGQQIVILNQSGASGMIGAEQLARATPDGYTIGGFNDSIMTMVPNLQPVRWDILKDFEPISLVATVEWGLITNPQSGFKSAADLIAAAKAAPGKIDYGSGGIGSPQHLAMELFASNAGIKLTHVPYRGATQAAIDVAAGQIPVGFQGLGTVMSLVQGRSGEADRRHHAKTPGAVSRRADRVGIRPSRLSVQLMVRHARAGRNARADHRAAQRRSPQGAGRSGRAASPRGAGPRAARQLGRGAAQPDARAVREIRQADSGDGYFGEVIGFLCHHRACPGHPTQKGSASPSGVVSATSA